MVLSVSRRSGMALFSRSDAYSHQVRLAIAEKGIEADIIQLTSSGIPEELAEVSPEAAVPTLVDRELVLYEPAVILEYLDERFPHPPLLPADPVSRARLRLSLVRFGKELYGRMDSILAGNGKTVMAGRRALSEDLQVLEPVFRHKAFFMSDEFTLADCMLAPLLWRLPQMKIELPSTAKALAGYANRLFKRPSFRLSLTEAEKELRS